MIRRLEIDGLAIIDSLSVEFSPGFNVITGETGAGKSILIHALNFLTGVRVTQGWVRKGKESATVTAEFVVQPRHPALAFLSTLGISQESQEGGPVIIRRQLYEGGKTQAWVNDIQVTNQTLRQLGSMLLDIFSQHENQRLLVEGEHLRYLDQFVDKKELLRETAECFRTAMEAAKNIRLLVEGFLEREKNRDYLEFRIAEFGKFAPSEEDFERVRELADRAGRMMKVREALSSANSALETSGVSAQQMIRAFSKQVLELESILKGGEEQIKLGELSKRAEALSLELDDLSFELGKLFSEWDVDEDELESAECRVFGYQDLFRKYGVKCVSSLMEEGIKIEKEHEELKTSQDILKRNLNELDRASLELNRKAEVLTACRKKAAEKVRSRVEKELAELSMKGATFQVEFLPVERTDAVLELGTFGPEISRLWEKSSERLAGKSEQGSEKGRFLLSSNPGEPVLPLSRIASGGEMSRILLALKKALIADADTCVLVFDEIDTGVSGRVADVVGEKLAELSVGFQVLCITHLPQVAAYANTHFLVAKGKKGSRTEAEISRLSPIESVQEVARLLSGAEVSNTALSNAKSLILRAKNRKIKGSTGSKKVTKSGRMNAEPLSSQ